MAGELQYYLEPRHGKNNCCCTASKDGGETWGGRNASSADVLTIYRRSKLLLLLPAAFFQMRNAFTVHIDSFSAMTRPSPAMPFLRRQEGYSRLLEWPTPMRCKPTSIGQPCCTSNIPGALLPVTEALIPIGTRRTLCARLEQARTSQLLVPTENAPLAISARSVCSDLSSPIASYLHGSDEPRGPLRRIVPRASPSKSGLSQHSSHCCYGEGSGTRRPRASSLTRSPPWRNPLRWRWPRRHGRSPSPCPAGTSP